MAKQPRRPEPLVGKIFLAQHAIDHGLLTRKELRSSAWRQILRGVYADASLPLSLRNRCFAAHRYLIPADGAIAGRSAAALYGAGTVAATEPIEVVVPRKSRFGPVRGLAIHTTDDLRPDDVRDHGGLALTTPLRTCWDVARWLDIVEAVVIIDIMLSRRLVTVADLEAYATARRGWRGWRRLRDAAALADAGAESPQESRLRVKLVVAGLPRPVPQYIVERGGRFLARVDLAWPEYKVAVEYDGLWHAADQDRIHRDRLRLNRLLGEDWIVLHVTAQRLRDDFDGFIAELRRALRARGASAGGGRG
ncbi:hypothetical protein WEI85_18435 [Actinomycetes bacterium KLBMP 9797]